MIQINVPLFSYGSQSNDIYEWVQLHKDRVYWVNFTYIEFTHEEDAVAFKLKFGL